MLSIMLTWANGFNILKSKTQSFPLLSSVWSSVGNFASFLVGNRLAFNSWISSISWVLEKSVNTCAESQPVDNDNFRCIWPNNGKTQYHWWFVLMKSTSLELGHMWYWFIQSRPFPLGCNDNAETASWVALSSVSEQNTQWYRPPRDRK